MEFTKDISFNMNPTVNNILGVTYNGYLGNSNELWIVYGFGENWENTSEIKMIKGTNGFYAEIGQLDYDTFNFCFKNENNEWDNNNSLNYISYINKEEKEDIIVETDNTNLNETSNEENDTVKNEEVTYKFDLNTLIDEMLQPLNIASTEEVPLAEAVIEEKPIDLGKEVSNALSQIDNTPENTELPEISNVEEILSGAVVNETPVELFEETENVDKIVNELIENTKNNTENIENAKNVEKYTDEYFEDYYENYYSVDNKLLVPSEKISLRKLSKFYLLRKKIKLTLYKAFIKIPKMILGLEND